jgi:predicted ATPase
VLDDLQWCERETLEWLQYLLRFDARARLLVVGTLRPEEVDEQHPLTTLLLNLRSNSQLTEIEVGPLNPTETAMLATQVAESDLDSETVQRLYQATEGNPLFVVEMVRATFSDKRGERGDIAPRSPIVNLTSLPPKVQAVIHARLAHLSPAARSFAQLAATFGRAFTFEALAKASDKDEETLVRELDELWQRRIIREQGGNAYDFSHDKLREVTYTDMSAARRRLLHRRVAQALETVHYPDLDSLSAQLAAHYEQAGLTEQAIAYYHQAATVAQHRSAYAETILHLHKSLTLLDTLVATSEHIGQKLDTLLLLGSILIMAKGFTAPKWKQPTAKRGRFFEVLKIARSSFWCCVACGCIGDNVVTGQLRLNWLRRCCG